MTEPQMDLAITVDQTWPEPANTEYRCGFAFCKNRATTNWACKVFHVSESQQDQPAVVLIRVCDEHATTREETPANQKPEKEPGKEQDK